MQSTQVEDSTWPEQPSLCATITDLHFRAHRLQLLKPVRLGLCSAAHKNNHRSEKPGLQASSPHSPQLEKACTQQWNTQHNQIKTVRSVFFQKGFEYLV